MVIQQISGQEERREGVSRKSTLGHVTKGGLVCKTSTIVHSRGGRGSKLGEIWSTSGVVKMPHDFFGVEMENVIFLVPIKKFTFEPFNKNFAIVDHGVGTRQSEADFHFGTIHLICRHSFFRRERVKNWPYLPLNNSKKTADGGR